MRECIAPMTEHFFDLRLNLIQHHLRNKLNCQALLVPQVDRYQGEYVIEAEERLAWLTGFTGSSGFSGTVQPQLAFAEEITSGFLPVFLNSKS